MSSNVGLSTPRGSGTSGYVQRSSAFLKPRDNINEKPADFQSHRSRQPDAAILEHDRRRQIEVKVFELRDKLEDEGKDEDEIDDACDALRKKLQAEGERSGGAPGDRGRLKSHQVHEIARAKIQEDEKLRRALGISKEYEEGSHWKRQEERKREVEIKKAQGDVVEKKPASRRERSESVSDRSRSPRRSRSPVRKRTPRSRSRSVSSRSGSYSD
ncbi:Pre-mRNA-splicing factor cwc-21-like protein [Elsinoe fawcettii]|nr:Pre-mRNA-splicing factor cwc-21-like protein [Elsinoe fawcettii]